MKRNEILIMLAILCHIGAYAGEKINVGGFFYEIDSYSLEATLVKGEFYYDLLVSDKKLS